MAKIKEINKTNEPEINVSNELEEHLIKAKEIRNNMVNTCKIEIEEILKKYSCKLVAVPYLNPSPNGWVVLTKIEITDAT